MKLIIGDVLAYIQENIFIKELKIEDIAVQFGYDKYHFSREFKKITGYSLSDYMSSLKSEKAIEMIDLDKNIINIQSEVGYSSSGSFSNTFKKYTGSSPKQYRKEMHSIYSVIKEFEESEHQEVCYSEHSSKSFCDVEIDCSAFKKGIIFIGFFNTPIPNHKPVSGIATKSLVCNTLKNIPDGNYYLLACAVSTTKNIFSYFNMKNCLRGRVEEKISFPISNGKKYIIKMRPPIPEDPPILINLSKLLISVFRKQHNIE